jgi:hypothetical protein
MGLKFRRGTNAQKSGSLAFGEPYVNTDLGTLQIGGLTGDITLGASGTGSQGSFAGISGSSLDITGNAKIDGNLTLGGTITIGDNSSDNVVVNADLSSSIIPNNDNSFDLGSTSFRYRAIHGTNIYGAINATNGVVSGSSQVIGILSSLNSFSASNGNTSLNSYTGSNDTTNTTQNTRLTRIEESTASLNAFSASQLVKDSTLQTYTASVDTKFGNIQASTASLNAFTNSFNSAIQLTGSNVNIAGNLTIAGTTTTVNSTNVAIADSVIELNYGGAVIRGGILVKDGTGGSNVSGSLLWDGTNDQWIAGVSGSESKILRAGSDSVISGSSQVLGILDSVNAFSASENTKNSTLGLYTASVDTKFSTLQTLTASMTAQVSRIQESTASLNAFSASENTKSETLRLYTASVDTKFSTLATYTGSNDTTNTAQNSRLTTLESVTGSYETKGRGIVSGSSQVVGSSITTNTITIGSTSTALGGTATTIAGLTSVSSTGFTGALTGNASTATTLATARTINGTSFNGSADITIANLVSGSSQITAGSTTNFATDVKTQLNTNTVVSGSGQINVASTTGDIALGTRTSGNYVASLVAGTNITLSNNSGEGATPTIGLTNNSTTIGSTAISLGSSSTTLAGLTSVTSTAFVGALTGNASTATTAGTVTTAAQTAITSVGTLTSLTVSGATATGALTVTGAITATGDITAYYSDGRLKENLEVIPNALEKVSKLTGYTYNTNALGKQLLNNENDNDIKVGVIAQDLQEVLPQAVKFAPFDRDAEGNSKSGENYLTVQYEKIVPLLIEAIKEQQIQIEELKAKIGL